MKIANNTLTVLNNGTETDITPRELRIIEEFKEAGLPGVTVLSDVQLSKCLDLYLSGKTYREIGRILRVKKEIVLFLAYKFNWYATKMEQLEILDANLKERILHAKLMNQDFLLQIQQFFNHKLSRKMAKFMATGDDEIAEQVMKKDVELYFKSVELLDKISSEKVPLHGKGPAVGLNMGDHGVTIKKVGEDEVVITPRNVTREEMLKYYADLNREKELKQKTNDITEEEPKTEKEENDETQK